MKKLKEKKDERVVIVQQFYKGFVIPMQKKKIDMGFPSYIIFRLVGSYLLEEIGPKKLKELFQEIMDE